MYVVEAKFVASHAILIMSGMSWVLLLMASVSLSFLLDFCMHTHTHTLHTTSTPRSKDRIIYYRYIEKDDLVIKNVTSTLVAHNCSGSVSSDDW